MVAAGMGAVFDCLTEVAADGSLRGELATAWEGSADARRWVFSLRKGVQFHDGSPFGAEDVIASLAVHRDPASPAWSIVAGIDGMRALTPHQVEITLAEGNADFPYLVSDYHLLIYPAGRVAEAMRDGIGTGLYRVHRFEPGKRLRATRVAEHWKDGQAGWFEALDFRVVGPGAERVQALQAGAIDAAAALPPAAVTTVMGAQGLVLKPARGNRFLGLAMRADAPPFDRIELRKALRHAIDRTALVRRALHGHGIAAADVPVAPGAPYHLALPVPEFDPDRARHHLRRAGHDRLRVALPVSDATFEGAVDMAWLMRDAARGAGIDLAVTERRGPVAGPSADAVLVPTESWGRATEDWILSAAFTPGAAFGTGWDGGPAFQRRLAEARASFDPALRQEIYHDLQRRVADQGSLVIPAFADHLQAVSKSIVTPERIGALWPMDDARFAERWWMA
jgi:peptide/nickel transport system substrate-binding protein